jgi:hypothetical protein
MRTPLFVVIGLFIAAIGLSGCGADVPTDQSQVFTTSPAGPQFSIDDLRSLELLKVDADAAPVEFGAGPALGSGGPDLFGYTWEDSDEPGGPVYSWTDISGVGTPLSFPSYEDDGTVGPIPIGFDFPFYGNTFSQLYVCSNGWMSFTNGSLETYSNQPLPSAGSSVPENLLAAWWDDMVYDESDGNEAYYYNDGSRFIVQMYIRRIADFSPPFYLFQVILYSNGDIVYQYNTLDVTLNSCTIGIQNGTKDDGLTVAYNDGAYPHEELAVRFSPPSSGMTIDIKPGSDDNPVNPRSQGVIPVAILTTPDFDATTVDVSTIAFGPLGATYIHRNPHISDVDGDGDMDLMLHFRTDETGIAFGDTEACLSAELLDGTPVEACDDVRTVPTEVPDIHVE